MYSIEALLHVAKVASEAKHATNWGLTYAEPKIDLGKLRSFKDGVVSKLTGGLGQLSKQRKITFVQGKASFIDAKNLSIELKAGGTDTLAFEHAIIATGSHPTKIPGLSITSDRLMDSTGALTCRKSRRRCLSSAADTSAWSWARFTQRSGRR